MNELEKQHYQDVIDVQKQVRWFYSQKKKFKIYHGTNHDSRADQFKKDSIVDLSKFSRIITVNTSEKYVLVEPNVSLGKLVQETMKYGFVPRVVPELSGITIGGAVQGGGGE